METRLAEGVYLPAIGGPEPTELGRGTNSQPSGGPAATGHPVLRLSGHAVEEAAESAAAAGSGSAIDRARSLLRFDPRGGARGGLRLVADGESDSREARESVGGARGATGPTTIAEHVARSVGPERFRRVFADGVGFTVEGSTVRVAASTRAAIGLIERRFGAAVREAAHAVVGAGATVEFVVAEQAGPAAGAPVVAVAAAALATPSQGHRSSRAAVAGQSGGRGRVYRLEDFVVGESNRLAYTAATQFAEGVLGSDASRVAAAPLFLHGPCGVGKTHLLHGLAHRFRERHPGAVVKVISGETFLNEFIGAIRHGGGSGMTGHGRSVTGSGGIERFRRQYRRCDLLCIDDVHLLASKQATQQELLHTFDQIVQGGGGGSGVGGAGGSAARCGGAKLVLVCDQHPRELKSGEGGFSPALVSRFLSGMVAGIEPPDAGLREAAARMFAQRRGLVLDDAAIRMLVERTGALPGQAACSVRDIEGLITRVEAVHRLDARGPSDTPHTVGSFTTARALAGTGGADAVSVIAARKPIRAEQIIAQTCMMLGVERSELAAATRHKRVVLARAMITHLCRELTTMSFPEIARAIGRPSHSTVITAHQRLTKQIAAGEVYGIGQGGEAMTIAGLARHLIGGLTRAATA